MKTVKRIAFVFAGLVLILALSFASLYFYLVPAAVDIRVADASTTRHLTSGDVVGFNDNGVSTWLGIPYSEPPLGELRWKAPRPVRPWDGQRESLTFGASCPQLSAGNSDITSEDCLFLNIWSPRQDTTAGAATRYPVMLWIHGGGNSVGGTSLSIYNGVRLSRDNKIVLVTISYRLGPLGWFRHPALRTASNTDADNSGNFGTLDIIMALNWVRDNILVFNGDPNNVTIFGESAGGFNVLTMMASPLAKGLFHKAISQSGGLSMTSTATAENYVDDDEPGHRLSSREIFNQMLIADRQADNRDDAKRQQEQMSREQQAQALYNLTPEDLLGLYSSGFGGMLGNPDLFSDGFVLPGNSTTQQIFSDTSTFNSVPAILGTNRNEMKLFLAFFSDDVSKTFGLPSGFNNLQAYNRDTGYATDGFKIRAVDDLATAMTGSGGSSVFAYRFDVDDWRDLGFIKLKELFGAAHALEVPFVFGNFAKPLRIIFPDSMQEEFNDVSFAMQSYWAEFAYTGSPGSGRSGQLTTWQPWRNSPQDALRLMVFDTDSDRGMRMVNDRMSINDLRQRLLSDTSYASQQHHCDTYKRIFTGVNFDADEYASLGTSGCKD